MREGDRNHRATDYILARIPSSSGCGGRGQIRGLQRMVKSDTYCIDARTQVAAATKAHKAVALGLLEHHSGTTVPMSPPTRVPPSAPCSIWAPRTSRCSRAVPAVRSSRVPVAVIHVVVAVDDNIKGSSTEAIAQVRQLGLRPVLLTGDDTGAAMAVAGQVGMRSADVIAEVLAHEKGAMVERLQGEGLTVTAVSHGVNDGAALAQAALGPAMGIGTDVAIEASDLTLVTRDLRAPPDTVRLARSTLASIKGNLFWASAYNVVAHASAARGLLSPLIVGAAKACSSLFVVSDILRVHTFDPSR